MDLSDRGSRVHEGATTPTVASLECGDHKRIGLERVTHNFEQRKYRVMSRKFGSFAAGIRLDTLVVSAKVAYDPYLT